MPPLSSSKMSRSHNEYINLTQKHTHWKTFVYSRCFSNGQKHTILRSNHSKGPIAKKSKDDHREFLSKWWIVLTIPFAFHSMLSAVKSRAVKNYLRNGTRNVCWYLPCANCYDFALCPKYWNGQKHVPT